MIRRHPSVHTQQDPQRSHSGTNFLISFRFYVAFYRLTRLFPLHARIPPVSPLFLLDTKNREVGGKHLQVSWFSPTTPAPVGADVCGDIKASATCLRSVDGFGEVEGDGVVGVEPFG